MNRSDIRGFTIKVLNLTIEFVTNKHILKTIAIYDKTNIKLLKRIEF